MYLCTDLDLSESSNFLLPKYGMAGAQKIQFFPVFPPPASYRLCIGSEAILGRHLGKSNECSGRSVKSILPKIMFQIKAFLALTLQNVIVYIFLNKTKITQPKKNLD